MQVCIFCKKEKAMIDFSFTKKDGLSNLCKTCQANKSRKLRRECPEYFALEKRKRLMFNPIGSIKNGNSKRKN